MSRTSCLVSAIPKYDSAVAKKESAYRAPPGRHALCEALLPDLKEQIRQGDQVGVGSVRAGCDMEAGGDDLLRWHSRSHGALSIPERGSNPNLGARSCCL